MPVVLVGAVVVAVVAIVIVAVSTHSPSGTTTTTPRTHTAQVPAAQPVTATIAREVTTIPASIFNAVGVTSDTAPASAPKMISGQPGITFDGKVGVLYVGAEYCPYCGAERWALAAAMARFGSVSGLETMTSSCTDVDPCTQTFTFEHARFTSPYITFEAREIYSNVPLPTGDGYEPLQKLNRQQTTIFSTYDTSKFTGGTGGGSFPFVDVDNRFLIDGASYSPAILQGQSRSQIAAGLATANSPVTRAIVATANYLSAAVCATDGDKPASVCTGAGVAAADRALGLSD